MPEHNPTSSPAAAALSVRQLRGWYGESQALHGIAFDVQPGEVVTLLGRNGAGKTSTLRSIMGLIRRDGSVRCRGQETTGLAPEQIARLGIGYVPEERGIFASLSVEENLMLPPVIRPGGMSLDEIHALFPNLAERRKSQGTKLSGGEQQMLAIARILRTGADIILLDEPTEGLAPVIIEQIGQAIVALKQRGVTLLMVEQNFHFARTISDRYYVFEDGRVVEEFPTDPLASTATAQRLNAYLGV